MCVQKCRKWSGNQPFFPNPPVKRSFRSIILVGGSLLPTSLPYFICAVPPFSSAHPPGLCILFFFFSHRSLAVFVLFFCSAGPSFFIFILKNPPSFVPHPFYSSMTAVNIQLMPSNMSLDFLPMHSHSRSGSVSSNSTHSNHSRPQSSQGNLNRMQPGMSPSAEDIYRASYNLGHHNLVQNDSVCLFFLLPAHVVNGWFSASASTKS